MGELVNVTVIGPKALSIRGLVYSFPTEETHPRFGVLPFAARRFIADGLHPSTRLHVTRKGFRSYADGLTLGELAAMGPKGEPLVPEVSPLVEDILDMMAMSEEFAEEFWEGVLDAASHLASYSVEAD